MAPAPKARIGVGMPVIGAPPLIRSVAPRAMFIIPRVTMKGCGSRNLVVPQPLSSPTNNPIATPIAMDTALRISMKVVD